MTSCGSGSTAGIECEHPDLQLMLDQLTMIDSDTPQHKIRAAMGAAALATWQRDLNSAVEFLLAARPLAQRVVDPMTRSNYWNRLSYILGLVARYQDAANAGQECLDEAKRYRLEFAIPHAGTSLAVSYLGLRHFNRARNLIAEAAAAAASTGDIFVEVNTRTLMARLLLAQGRSRAALDVIRAHPEVPVAMPRGEYLATRALALIVVGEHDDAMATAQRAVEETSTIETHTLVLWINAIAALMRESFEAEEKLSVALQKTLKSGHGDALVCAYRAWPRLLVELAALGLDTAGVAAIVHRARDDLLARQAGLPIQRSPVPVSGLTAREREVHTLLCEGLTNREIAQRLFISETTAKVHVRHILEKLGVRSRTEVVVLSARAETPRETVLGGGGTRICGIARQHEIVAFPRAVALGRPR